VLYRYFWGVVFLVFKGIFKRAFFHNTQAISKHKSIILASNHCNAFLDPVAVGSQIPRALNFLVRGDIFNTPLKRYILGALHQIPIFRARDGFGSIKEKSEETFTKVYKILEDGKIIMIFPEGDCFPEKRLRPLKKGVARMAFGVMVKNNWKIDPYILPTAINYTYHTQIRTELIIGFDEAIRIKDYEALYLENENKAILKLTQDIASGIKNQLIEIPKKIEVEAEQMLRLFRSTLSYNRFIWRRNENNRLRQEKALVENFEKLETLNPEKYVKLLDNLRLIGYDLKKHKITEDGLSAVNNKSVNYLSYLAFPIYLISLAINKPIKIFIEKKVQKMIKKGEFKLSIKMGFLMAIYHVLAIFILVAFWSLFNFCVGVLSLVILYFIGWWGTLLNEIYESNKQIKTAKSFKKNFAKKYTQISDLKKDIQILAGF